ncbi:TetR/AcrR family transcriptional regulator [Glycomyces tritici]|uniref:TetR family transcriptional regulator n=1 Tax=Glycomyces tritici TaxID=2665176 RepID=A0ABT7YU88_9ACTN|nr:TetR/AcrR family transcriptional regulator [Glycomyces tritici]MDN3241939.1 TetR family transcriptional regulator [Glycomyces tritici]
MSEPKRRDRDATRAALLEAARRRFTEHGFDGTGVRDIAADAGVDPTLIFRYFGSKQALFTEAVHVEVPEGLGRDPRRGLVELADALLGEVVFADRGEPGTEHPLLVMLRSAGRPEVRAQLRDQVCGEYLADFAKRSGGEDAELRAEILGALLVGMGLMRSVIGTPALSAASYDQTRAIVAAMVGALQERPRGLPPRTAGRRTDPPRTGRETAHAGPIGVRNVSDPIASRRGGECSGEAVTSKVRCTPRCSIRMRLRSSESVWSVWTGASRANSESTSGCAPAVKSRKRMPASRNRGIVTSISRLNPSTCRAAREMAMIRVSAARSMQASADADTAVRHVASAGSSLMSSGPDALVRSGMTSSSCVNWASRG